MMDINHSGFFVLRTPLLPFDDASHWGDSLACAEAWRCEADAGITKQAWLDDLTSLRVRLRELLHRPAVMQALAIASPSLQAGIAIWERDPETKKGLQAERSLVRYFLRMAGRSTPFGLFSGCSVGVVRPNSVTELVLAPREQYRSATRLDFDYLFTLTSELRRNRNLQMEMLYGKNSSLHRIGGRWHYIESRASGLSRTHHLVRVSADDYLDNVLSTAEAGNSSYAELVASIRSCEGSESLTEEEIDGYLSELINSEILVASISPLLTGDSPLDDLLNQLQELPSAVEIGGTLGSIRETLSALDQHQLDVKPEEYGAIASRLKTLNAQADEARLLQVDMYKPARSANLGQAILDQLYLAIDILGRFATPNEPADLIHFREAFSSRYEQEWVPLVEAVDL